MNQGAGVIGGKSKLYLSPYCKSMSSTVTVTKEHVCYRHFYVTKMAQSVFYCPWERT